MFNRLMSAAVAIVLLFIAVGNGGWIFRIMGYGVILLALYEYYRSAGILNAYTFSGGLLTVVFLELRGLEDLVIALTFMMMAFLVAGLFSEDLKLDVIGKFQVSIFYIVIPIYMLLTLEVMGYMNFVGLIFLIAWFSDTFAFFTGRFLGRRPLAPRISPKKTVEGAVGGLLGALVMSLIYYRIMGFEQYLPMVLFGLIVLGMTALSQIGDLVASKIKRTLGVKDFGKVMPGHGGILDRFDSVIILIPIVYYAVTVIL